MTNREHRRLAKILNAVKGMVAISNYQCDLYGRVVSFETLDEDSGAGGNEPCYQRQARRSSVDELRRESRVLEGEGEGEWQRRAWMALQRFCMTPTSGH